MERNEIDKAAFSGIDILPKLSGSIDKLYYIATRTLYECHRAGVIDIETAALRKKQIEDLCGRFDIDLEIYRRHRAIEEAFGGYRRDLEICGCESCKKMLRLIDGRQLPDCYFK